MRMDKGAILVSMAIIMVASVLVGAGTMAWFSTGNVTTSTYTMNTATMTMEITTVPYTFDNLVPGQTFGPIVIKIKNTGTMDILYLSGSMVLSGSSALADKIDIVDWYEYIPGYGWIDNLGHDFPAADEQHYETLVEDEAAPLTLLELAQSYVPYATNPEPQTSNPGGYYLDQWGNYVKHPDDWITGGGYDQTPGPAIIVGGEYQMKLWFKFSEEAGNNLQGKSVSFTITFIGVQDLSQLP